MPSICKSICNSWEIEFISTSMRKRPTRLRPRSIRKSKRRRQYLIPSTSKLFLLFIFITQIIQSPTNYNIIPKVEASGIITDLVSSTYDRLFPEEDLILNDDYETKTLNIVEISNMRARDIKRRLARSHGYGVDELSRMLDKKELINTLSFEEHKAYQKEADRRKWIRFKNTVIYTCAAILIVMFWPLLRQAFEAASVNFVVYTDRRKHEISRCRDYNSYKGYFGIFILFIMDALSFWLSTSVLLSWVMSSKYFFPTPNIPIRPAQLLTPTGGDAGALGQYGINVGPMIIRFGIKFVSGKVENMIGRAIQQCQRNIKRKEKELLKKMRKEEKAKDKAARKEAKRLAKIAKQERIARRKEMGDYDSSDDESYSDQSFSGMTPSNVRNIPLVNMNDDTMDPAEGSDFHDLD